LRYFYKYIPAFLIFILAGTLFSQNDSIRNGLVLVSSFGKFRNAVSVSTAREEFVFVSDLETNKIYKFGQDGTELASFGGSGMGENELNQPFSIDASNGLDVLVADYQNNKIKRLDINLNYLLAFDFNSYNLSAESTRKIYNPRSILTLSSGEVFVVCDATNYRLVKLNDYSEVSIMFGSNSIGQEKLDDPVKAVKGSQLDMWVLDKKANTILNFNNFGLYVKTLEAKLPGAIISIAYFNDNLFILHASGLVLYDLKKGQYSNYYSYPEFKDLTDAAVLDKNTVLFLSKRSIRKYRFN
jgi:hypothetical protein